MTTNATGGLDLAPIGTDKRSVRSLSVRLKKSVYRGVKMFGYVLDGWCNQAMDGYLPYRVYAAAYGLAWSLESGRVSGTLYLAIKAKDVKGLADLVAAIAANCEVSGDVPYWLNQNADKIA